MKLDKSLAFQVVNTIKDTCGQDINFIDKQGMIFASTNADRIGTFHAIGHKAAQTEQTIEVFSDVDFHEADTNKLSIIDEIKFYFDINYAENLKLKDVADYFGIHQNYLTRAFHEKFGISPKKYLLQLKFKKAARLLATTQLPVSIISNSLGFEDQLAFSRTFKKFYNVSPTDYRSHLKP